MDGYEKWSSKNYVNNMARLKQQYTPIYIRAKKEKGFFDFKI